MNIYRPITNGLSQMKTDNPYFWNCLLERSQYNESEILATLAEIETVNDEWQAFQAEVYQSVLTDEYGEMNSRDGYASEVHREIDEALFNGSYVHPQYSQNEHINCLPVRKWQKEIKATRRYIVKIKKMISNLDS